MPWQFVLFLLLLLRKRLFCQVIRRIGATWNLFIFFLTHDQKTWRLPCVHAMYLVLRMITGLNSKQMANTSCHCMCTSTTRPPKLPLFPCSDQLWDCVVMRSDVLIAGQNGEQARDWLSLPLVTFSPARSTHGSRDLFQERTDLRLPAFL